MIELGYPTLIALNMIDVAEENGHQIDAGKLAGELGVPVLPLVASTGQGLPELRQAILSSLQAPPRAKPRQFSELPAPLKAEADWPLPACWPRPSTNGARRRQRRRC